MKIYTGITKKLINVAFITTKRKGKPCTLNMIGGVNNGCR